MEKYEVIQNLQSLKKRIEDVEAVIKPVELKNQIDELEKVCSSDDFWNDLNKAKSIMKDSNHLKERFNKYLTIKNQYNNLFDSYDVAYELEDEELIKELETNILDLLDKLGNFETELLLNEKYDASDCIIELHPGAGGTESQDWTLMLYRMYTRYFEKKGYDIELTEYEEANDAGLKSVTLIVHHEYAYGYLKSEKGVHRLIRISPFDSNSRRHTSFVAVNVYPIIENNDDIEINPNDLKIDTYRSSGAGGQHINKTDSAVRITHIPTGIVVSCQNQRSQIQNKEKALEVLRAKIYLYNESLKNQELKSYSGDVTDNAFGNQIRTYTLQPYTLVKDHRTNFENGNPSSVLDGDLDPFINAYLQYNKKNN